jgi:hypothetical protein
MAPTKAKGDLAELKVAADLVAKGYGVSLPFGEDSDYDLIVDRDGELERVQVKYASSKRGVIAVNCRSHSWTNGKVRRTKRYTPAMIDWIAVYDPSEDRCYYVPSNELGPSGRAELCLRVTPARNGQQIGVRYARDYEGLRAARQTELAIEREPTSVG